MSHKATQWLASIAPDEVSHAEFRVLFHLCDCHNPSHGCFPSQKYLLEMCALSNGGLNNALASLESKGLIRREKRHQENTGKRIPTRYFMPFEADFEQSLTPLNGDGSISTFDGGPSPLLGQNHLHMRGVVTKAEPVKEPVSKPVTREEGLFPDLPKPEAKTTETIDQSFEQFWAAYPQKLGSSKKNAKTKFAAALKLAKAEDLIRAAAAYAKSREREDAKFTKHAEFWLSGQHWEGWLAAPEIDPERARLHRIIAEANAASRPQLPPPSRQ